MTDLPANSTLGAALQAGFDYNFASRWFLNMEVDQVFVANHANVNTILSTVVAKAAINPFLFGVGADYRF